MDQYTKDSKKAYFKYIKKILKCWLFHRKYHRYDAHGCMATVYSMKCKKCGAYLKYEGDSE